MKRNHNGKEKDSNWESLCNQCGLCCFEKIENDNGSIFFTRTPCRYLDVVTRKCKIYDRRFEVNPECVQLTQELVKEISWLHDGCGYRQAMKATGLKPTRTRRL